MESVNLKEPDARKLEQIWTDKTPDHLDPNVKRYWFWFGFVMVNIYFFLIFFMPSILAYSLGACVISYVVIMAIFTVFAIFYFDLLFNSYTFLLTDDMVLIEKGVIWKRKNAIPYSRVQNVNITCNPLERIFNLATVHIHTAGMGLAYAEGRLPGIPFPDELSEIILRKVRRYKFGAGLEGDVLEEDVDHFLQKFREYIISKGRK